MSLPLSPQTAVRNLTRLQKRVFVTDHFLSLIMGLSAHFFKNPRRNGE
jgi:hypothetical protein